MTLGKILTRSSRDAKILIEMKAAHLHIEPVAALADFVEKATTAGIYSTEQARLFRMAIKVLLKAAKEKLGRPAATVGDAAAGLEGFELVPDLQRASTKAYASRARKVVEDYFRLAALPEQDWVNQTQLTPGNRRQQMRLALDEGDTIIAVLLPTGRRGEIRLPGNLSSEEAMASAKQLEAIRHLLVEQARVLSKQTGEKER